MTSAEWTERGKKAEREGRNVTAHINFMLAYLEDREAAEGERIKREAEEKREAAHV